MSRADVPTRAPANVRGAPHNNLEEGMFIASLSQSHPRAKAAE